MKNIFDTRINISKLPNNILYEYLIFNNTNFDPFLLGEKDGFL